MGVIIHADEVVEEGGGYSVDVGMGGSLAHSWRKAFSTPLFCQGAPVAEVGFDADVVEKIVRGELRVVLEGDGFSYRRRHRSEQPREDFGNVLGVFGGQFEGGDNAGATLLDDRTGREST